MGILSKCYGCFSGRLLTLVRHIMNRDMIAKQIVFLSKSIYFGQQINLFCCSKCYSKSWRAMCKILPTNDLCRRKCGLFDACHFQKAFHCTAYAGQSELFWVEMAYGNPHTFGSIVGSTGTSFGRNTHQEIHIDGMYGDSAV